ncbi:2-polyprenyl-6-methoxyphenol hydroxylase [Mytilinidion resinicola]|uniref:2-polyprenyl-6-methoxyphenol hydroxylase n=1 Tax=Mytilinidion resinicola TaxID=574789 RepID=A0A6A6YR61_9PEZI|nr:2-polyprenyl-6-methoxyphenol hydroxylase [Mytilinidion resinicola]KAF2811038.1 2-polyprenyl-6-methoxyphenol hydroxylase [Mytilinidion resinicola]
MVQRVDVLICGSGSAGLCAALWLARSGINFKILDKRSERMTRGQADGVQCRTVEIFESFGVAEDLLRDAYHVLEVVFWESNGKGSITRTGRTADTAPGISHQPHVILNQARLNGILLDLMARSNGQDVEYGYEVKEVRIDSAKTSTKDEYPVTVTTEKDGKTEIFEAKYVLGCDGAHSTVRRSLGYKMIGDSTDAVWGVMDIYPRTNFPDIRKKALLYSDHGNLLIIPREGGSLVRFYVKLPDGRIAKNVKLEDVHDTARRIFQGYDMEFADTYWWSAYSIGQRLVDHFSKDDRVFLTGDACHTHAPKAGQGMNVSLQDGYNIGWKLAAVLNGRASPDLLKTYSLERQKVASDLIDFDRNFMKLFSQEVKHEDQTNANLVVRQFVATGPFTAGITAKYNDSEITFAARSKPDLAVNLHVGMRFPSAQVVRLCDARAMQLQRALPSDGRWRLVIFAGDIRDLNSAKKLDSLAKFLSSQKGLVQKFTREGDDIDSFIDPVVVLHGARAEIEQEHIPSYFQPVTSPWGVRDLHKIFIDDESYNSGHGKAYEAYGVDVQKGALAIVRPDQYISMVISLEDYDEIDRFFNGFARPQN